MHVRTTISMKHSLEIMKNADRTVVFEKGLLVDAGPNDILIEQKGGLWSMVVVGDI